MVICAIVSCHERSDRNHREGVRFFSIPKVIRNQCELTRDRSERRRALWLSRINRKDLRDENVKDYTKVCSRHFIRGAPAKLFEESSPDWAPSLNLGQNGLCDKSDTEQHLQNSEQTSKKIKIWDSQAAESNTSNCVLVDVTFQDFDSKEESSDASDLCGLSASESYTPHCVMLDDSFQAYVVKEEASFATDLCESAIAGSIPSDCLMGDDSFQDFVVKEESLHLANLCESAATESNTSDCLMQDDSFQDMIDTEEISNPASLCGSSTCNIVFPGREQMLRSPCSDLVMSEKSKEESTDISNEMLCELYSPKRDYSQLQEDYRKLRDQLTEASVDKLELERDLALERSKTRALLQEKVLLEEKNSSLSRNVVISAKQIEQITEKTEDLQKKLDETKKELEMFRHCTLHLDDLKIKEKVKFYTGLPNFSTFESVLNHVCAQLKEASTASLQPWQSLLLTLMRLRLALNLQDLAYRFGVNIGTACHIFERWLHALYMCLGPVVNSPSRETICKTMPTSFKDAFGNSAAVIIDCFEVLIDKPANVESKGNAWSTSKHHNTVKFLVGFTPSGAISFISETSGGRTSDKHMCAISGLYENLLQCDLVMSDSDFDVEDSGFPCEKLESPAFKTKNQAKTSSHDITDTRYIASLRKHVKRVIGLVRRKFHILQSTLPSEFLIKKAGHEVSQIDEIVFVCCALVNLRN